MLKVKGLSYSDNTVQLNNIDFAVDSGDFFVICGPDDSGKTEILNMIMNISVPDEGDILYKQEKVNALSRDNRKTIRFVPDEILTEKNMTAKRYLEMMAKRYQVKEDIGVEQLLQYFNIDVHEQLMDMTFESNKMVFIIGALMTGPELLILDEPSNFLTEATTQKLMRLLARFNSCGMTVLMVVEKYEQAEEYCNRFMYIKDGEVVNISDAVQRVEAYRSVTVKGGNIRIMNAMLGEPVAEDGDKRTYITNRSLPQIGIILNKSGVSENDMDIRSISVEEALDMRQMEDTEE